VHSITQKFETHTAEVEFVYATHNNRQQDIDTWPWDQTTKHAAETSVL